MYMVYIETEPNSDVEAIRKIDVKLINLYGSLIGQEILGTKRPDGSQKRYTGGEMAEEIRDGFCRLQKHIRQGDVYNTCSLDIYVSGITNSPESGGLRTQVAQLFKEFIEAYYGKSM